MRRKNKINDIFYFNHEGSQQTSGIRKEKRKKKKGNERKEREREREKKKKKKEREKKEKTLLFFVSAEDRKMRVQQPYIIFTSACKAELYWLSSELSCSCPSAVGATVIEKSAGKGSYSFSLLLKASSHK